MALTRPKYSQIYDTDYKQSVRVATTADVGNLLSTANMTNTVDGKTLAVGDRILVKDQIDATQNGIYRVTVVGTGVNGTWIRDHDADTSEKVTSGLTTTVAEGTVNIGRTYKLSTPDPITLLSSSLTFVNPFAAVATGNDTQIQYADSTLQAGAVSLHYFKGNGVVFANAGVASTSTTTGTLQVTGGIGASGNINAGNVIATNLTGTLTTASQPNITTLAGVTSIGASGTTTLTGTLQTASQPNVTTLAGVTSIGAGGATTLTGTLQTASQPNITTLAGVTSIGASGTTTLTGILQTAAQTNVTSLGTLTSLSTGAITTTGTLALNAAGGLTTNQTTFLLANATATTVNIGGAATTLNIGATTGTLNLNNATTAIAGVSTHAGIMYANATTVSSSSTTGALVVAGGVGISGNLHLPSTYQLHIGPELVSASFPQSIAQFNSSVNSYQQIVMQNISTGTSASSDFVAVADSGTDSTNYIDMGINSSTYSDTAYTIGGSLDGYLYTNGGNLLVGTQTSGKGIVFHTGGTLSAQLRGRFTDQGLTINTTTSSTSITSGALVVNGGVGVAGDMWVGGALHVANLISSSTSTLEINAPLVYLEASPTYPYNYDIGLYSHFTGGSGNTYQHTGFVRSYSSSAWNLVSNVAEPTAGAVSLTNAIYDAINTGAHTINGNPTTAIVNGGTSGTGNIGSSSAVWNTVYATTLQGTLTTVSQPNITTLAGVTSIGASGTTTLTGTLQTASQTNITGVGNITAGTWSATILGSGYGGTGINNGGRTLTISTNSGTVSFTSAATTLTVAATASVSGTNTGDQTTVSGNAGTATTLQTARNINGTSFNGSADITVTANAATLTGVTLNSTVLASSLTSVGTLAALTVTATITGSVSGSAATVTGAAQTAITSVGTLTALTVSGALSSGAHTITGSGVTAIINGGTTGVGNIGATGATFNTAFLKATTAQYADLAEKYTSDKKYVPGTVVVFGGNKEITISTISHDTAVAGVISTEPAYLMNSELDGLPVALQGRVPCRVQGPVNKGELVVTSDTPGVAQRLDRQQYFPGCVIGKALEEIIEERICTIEVVVGRV